MPTRPIRKISETIIDFGEPLTGQLDASQPHEVVHATFNMVVLIWNAHVMATPRWDQPRFLADLQERMRDPSMAPEMVEAHLLLAQRRAELFKTDTRAVGEWSIFQDNGIWRLRCDARSPLPIR